MRWKCRAAPRRHPSTLYVSSCLACAHAAASPDHAHVVRPTFVAWFSVGNEVCSLYPCTHAHAQCALLRKFWTRTYFPWSECGNSARADDVRVTSISASAAQTQGSLINAFCKANSLKLNVVKQNAASGEA